MISISLYSVSHITSQVMTPKINVYFVTKPQKACKIFQYEVIANKKKKNFSHFKRIITKLVLEEIK